MTIQSTCNIPTGSSTKTWIGTRRKRTGLTDDEVFILTYFSDIESQTIMYMRDILNTEGVLDPDVMSFLTIWNYEEFYHGRAIAKLLEECGHPLGDRRVETVRSKALITET
jgi:hypothetical protein